MYEEDRWMDDRETAPDAEMKTCRLIFGEGLPGVLASGQWSKGICPNCGFERADVDPDGVLWCPACNYSAKGAYT
jgi:rubrerythrin